MTEWIISLVFTFYVLSFSIDLFPAAKDKQLNGNFEQGELGNQKHGADHEMTPQNGRYHANGGTGYTQPAVNGIWYDEGVSRPVAAQNF